MAARLTSILEASDGAGDTVELLIDFFDGMAEPDRRALAMTASDFTFRREQEREAQRDEDRRARRSTPGSSSPDERRAWALLGEARLAAFATQSVAAFEHDGRPAWLPEDSAIRILEGRDAGFAAAIVARFHERALLPWDLMRWAIRTGRAVRPDTDAYLLRMFPPTFNTVGPYELLTDDRELLDYELWRLFEIPGNSDASFANSDQFGRLGTWHDALLRLVEEGSIDRVRLLDACLNGLAVAPNHYQARWFHQMFDALEPTLDEVDERHGVVLPMTSNPVPNVAKWAFAQLTRLYKHGRLGADATTLGHVRPLLGAKAASTTKKALVLLAKIAKADLEMAASVADAAVAALSHESVDVQAAAWKLIHEHHPTDPLRSAVERTAGLVAPTLRSQVAAWLGAYAAPAAQPSITVEDLPSIARFSRAERDLGGLDELISAVEADRFEVPALRFDGTEIPRLTNVVPIEPIEDLDSLVAVASHVLEHSAQVDSFELMLDGIARLYDDKPDDFDSRTSPLRKRVDQLTARAQQRGWPGSVLACACGVLTWWLDSSQDPPDSAGHFDPAATISEFLYARCASLMNRLAKRGRCDLLSAPTHTGGWIDPMVLVQRVNRLAEPPETHDLHLALLRLAPEGRAEARAKLQPRRVEWIRAVGYALGSSAKPGPTRELWIAASRARSGWDEDRRFERAFPGRGLGPVQAPRLRAETRAYSSWESWMTWPYVGSHLPVDDLGDPNPDGMISGVTPGSNYGMSTDLITWAATMWPSVREHVLEVGVRDIARNLDWDAACWENASYLEPLLDPGLALRDSAIRLLVLGLAAKESGEYGLATDVAIAAIDDGRLGTDNLADTMRELLPLGLKPRRWSDRLADVAAASDLHAHIALSGVIGILQGTPAEMPRGYGALIELALQLATRLSTGVSDDQARSFLRSITGSSKAAKAARALLELDHESVRVDLVAHALELRVERLAGLAAAPTIAV